MFITAGSRHAGDQGVSMAALGGRVILYASTYPAITWILDWNRVHYRELNVIGSAGKTEQDFRDAVCLFADAKVTSLPWSRGGHRPE